MFIFIVFSTSIKSATIRGIVIDYINKEVISSAEVRIIKIPVNNKTLLESYYYETTNDSGYFIFKNIPIGNYEIHISKYYDENSFNPVHYRDFYDTLNLIDNDSIINLNVKLKRWAVYIDTVKSIEKYHNYFKTLDPNNILSIKLDSLSFGRYYWKLYSTFYNKTDSTIFLIKELECLRLAESIVTNSKGQIMKRNMVSFDCMGKSLPDSSDIIEILPHDSAKYNPVTLKFHNFYYYPKDTYSIKLEYKYERRKTLPGAFANPRYNYEERLKKQIYYFNVALRGDYISNNSIIFNNSKVIKN